MCAHRDPLSSREPNASAPMHEPTASMASCTPSTESRCSDFITAVMEVSNAVKLMLKTTNTSSSGISTGIGKHVAFLLLRRRSSAAED